LEELGTMDLREVVAERKAVRGRAEAVIAEAEALRMASANQEKETRNTSRLVKWLLP